MGFDPDLRPVLVGIALRRHRQRSRRPAQALCLERGTACTAARRVRWPWTSASRTRMPPGMLGFATSARPPLVLERLERLGNNHKACQVQVMTVANRGCHTGQLQADFPSILPPRRLVSIIDSTPFRCIQHATGRPKREHSACQNPTSSSRLHNTTFPGGSILRCAPSAASGATRFLSIRQREPISWTSTASATSTTWAPGDR